MNKLFWTTILIFLLMLFHHKPSDPGNPGDPGDPGGDPDGLTKTELLTGN
jgi:hypothetical protein